MWKDADQAAATGWVGGGGLEGSQGRGRPVTVDVYGMVSRVHSGLACTGCTSPRGK